MRSTTVTSVRIPKDCISAKFLSVNADMQMHPEGVLGSAETEAPRWWESAANRAFYGIPTRIVFQLVAHSTSICEAR